MSARSFQGICAGLALAGWLLVSSSGSFPAWGVARAQGSGAPAAADSRIGRDVLVVLLNGQRMRGVLVEETPRYVVVRVGNINSRLTRDQIRSLVVQRPVEERYREMRAIIDDTDVERLLVLVEWLRTHGLLDEALHEVLQALAVEPDNGKALKLKDLVERQIVLRAKAREEKSGESAERSERGATRAARRPKLEEFPLLDEDQVNLLKVYEINLGNPPRLLVGRDTIQKLVNRNPDSPLVPHTREGRAAFYRKSPEEILAVMFDLRERELYGEVRVMGLPISLRRFRDHVHSTWLVNSCATTKCHGGTEAGRLLLFNRKATSEAAVLTNFLILERFELADGTPLIDYESPVKSPLLQMALPREESIRPHPDVYGWKPAVRSRDHRRFMQAVDWIRTMHRPRPEHPIQYVPPTAKAETETPSGADR